MSKFKLTAHIEKKKFEYVGICNPPSCLKSVTATDIVNTSTDNVDGVTLTASMCESGNTDCTTANVVAYLLPVGKEPIDCLYCCDACDEIKDQDDGSVSITRLPESFNDYECISECIKQIKWSQDYYTSQSMKYDSKKGTYKTQKKRNYLDSITLNVTIPSLCGLTSVYINSEISGCYSSVNYAGVTGEIPTDSSAGFWVHNGKWSITFDYKSTSFCFFPGEYIVAYANLLDYSGRCNPLLIGWTYFETKCLTSGVVRGCGLINDETKSVSKERIYLQSGVYTALSNNNVKSVTVYDSSGKKVAPNYSYSATETVQVKSKQTLKHKDIVSAIVYVQSDSNSFSASDYSIDTTSGTITVPAKSSMWKYDFVTVWYKYVKRNYDFDAATGLIRVSQNSVDLKSGEAVYVDYKYVKSTVDAGGDGFEFQNEWQGSNKLHWYVTYKGKRLWLKCSDFVKWKNGDRVLIHKGGPSKLKAEDTEAYITMHKCRIVDESNQEPEDDTLSDSAVAYSLDRGVDFILPIKVTL
ncbi:MAG: hypothetical protein HQK88_05940 [Nitrospirae bacterium]|nr:hypothetical protein [Nitrospirota bacterium]MBF0534613.1 hypothetical protein [Nitrospirota bacterium]MBF0616343.1 hypothetical protein [Nitrospirota bacterium]